MVSSLASKLLLPLLTIAMVTGCGKEEKAESESGSSKAATQVAAKVNDKELTVHQVNYALQGMGNLGKDQAKAASLQVVRNLVEQELLVQKAIEQKLDRDSVVVQSLDAMRRQILAEAYMTRKLGVPAEPSDTEVADYFDKHPELFSKRKIYRLQELAIKVDKDKHEEIRGQLAAAKTLNDFVQWLKAENISANAAQGVKPAEQLPMELLAKLAEMPDGQAMMVNIPDGLMVIVLADSQSQPVTLEQAKPAIIGVLKNQARQKAAKAELDALKAAAKIEYLGEFVDAGKEPAESKPATPAAEAPAGEAAPSADAEAISKGVSGLK